MQKNHDKESGCYHFASPNKIVGSGNNQQKMLKPIAKEEFYNGRIGWNQLINLSTTKNGTTRHYVCNTKYTAKSVEYFKLKNNNNKPEPKSSQVSNH